MHITKQDPIQIAYNTDHTVSSQYIAHHKATDRIVRVDSPETSYTLHVSDKKNYGSITLESTME